MSKEYDLYLEEHKANVAKGFHWIEKNLSEIIEKVKKECGPVDLTHQICTAHDWSKSDQEEYEPYDKYFYGKNRSYAVVRDFNYAWLRHIHHNPHHWQYYILFEDDPKSGVEYFAMDMPANYILEMICDWWAFSWKSGNLREIFDWYKKHEKTIVISLATRNLVDSILKAIDLKLTEMENAAEG